MRWFFLFTLILILGCTSFSIKELENERNPYLLFPYTGVIGEQGSGTGQYLNPEDVGVDTKGNIYILDKGTNRILVFNDSLFSHQFGGFGTGTGRLNDPSSFVVSPNYLYVYDAGAEKISKYNLNGDFVGSIFENNNMDRCAMALDDFGNIYICSSEENKIVKISNAGEEIVSFGSFGWGEGFLDNPQGITVSSNGDIYVSDTDNSRVEIFNSQGQFKREIGKGVLKRPIDLDIDSWDNLFICDIEVKKIFIFDREGKLKNEIKAMVEEPVNIAISENGKLYIADRKARRVFSFRILYGSGDKTSSKDED
ncbi:MAG: 6-bladed beta-propeller [Candidatus Cloacimonadota bacterium]|nr:MAG: 6-bladed beta-propeller [Candidatus Cloacimonadota bacterium]